MTFTQKSKKQFTMIVIAALGIVCSLTAFADPSSPATPTVLSATDKNAGANVGKVVPGAAAMVDDHIIPMDDLVVECLRKYRTRVIDEMMQNYVVDRECKKRGITVTDAEIDKRIEDVRKKVAPATLDETLKAHHMSMADLRHSLEQEIEASMLVADQIKPPRMLHVREILVKFKKANGSASGTNRTEAEALAIVKDLQAQLNQGKDFGTLAEKHTESLPADKKGDLGIFYDHMPHMEDSFLTTALALGKGEISQQVETPEGYCLLQAVSTGDDHPPAENSLYEDADKASRNLQTMSLGPKTVVDLIKQSKITAVKDADLIPGKPLPAAAAVIDGHPIPMRDVVARCLADNGPATLDVLVQSYLVDRECKQRGITVSAAEIDQRVDKLREQIKPGTLEEGLAYHHTTLALLRYDFQQEIERQKLVIDQVKPIGMLHARVILVRDNPSATSESLSDTPCAEAQKLITDIQSQLKAGKSFEELAKQYSVPNDKTRCADFVLYEGMYDMDPTILKTALAMKKGEITTEAKQILGKHFFLQIISTSDSHASDEDAAYAAAFAAYREGKAQSMVSQAIADLLKKSKVIYYVHA